jgi:hypothetical protein
MAASMSTIRRVDTSLYDPSGACSRLAGEFEFVDAEGLALGGEDRESSLAGAGKCIELLAA